MTRDKLRLRFVGDVRDEIKRVALRQLTSGGPSAISVNAIGRELDVSGPALYRYFDSRDALLTALIVDAYDDLAATIEQAVASRRTARTRLEAFAAAYRQWALAQPPRYRLLFRAPLPGYDPNAAELVRAAQRSMDLLLAAIDGTPRAADRALTIWSRLHGLVSLEIEDVFVSMGVDPARLYARELTLDADR